jgi:hypothetical protein
VCPCGARLTDDATECERCGPLPDDHPLKITKANN